MRPTTIIRWVFVSILVAELLVLSASGGEPQKPTQVKVAAGQMLGYDKTDVPRPGFDPSEPVVRYVERAAKDSAQLVVFPEYLLGRIPVPGPQTERISKGAYRSKHQESKGKLPFSRTEATATSWLQEQIFYGAGPRYLDWRFASTLLSVVEVCLKTSPNEDGSLPQVRAEDIWSRCYGGGQAQVPFCEKRWAICRDWLESQGIIKAEGNGPVPIRAPP